MQLLQRQEQMHSRILNMYVRVDIGYKVVCLLTATVPISNACQHFCKCFGVMYTAVVAQAVVHRLVAFCTPHQVSLPSVSVQGWLLAILFLLSGPQCAVAAYKSIVYGFKNLLCPPKTSSKTFFMQA
jgi:hypothetical protein